MSWDLAVGVIIGAAFGEDCFVAGGRRGHAANPAALRWSRGFSGLFINLSGETYETLAEAKAATTLATTLNYAESS